MTTYAWPTSLEPASCTLALLPNVREFASPYTGTYEVVDLIGERWQLSVQMPQMLRATAAAHEAFFNRLRGVHTLSVPYFDRPEPLGTARGSIVLASTAAQGASSLAITAATAFPNLITGGSFEIDTNADGLADSWLAYSNGSTGAITRARTSASTAHGAWSQTVEAATLGGTSSDHAGIYRNVPVVANQPYTLTASLRAATGTFTGRLFITWRDASLVIISNVNNSPTVTSSWQRFALSGSAPANAASADIFVFIQQGGGALCRIEIDAVQFDLSPASATATNYASYATLKAGDMLGCSGQLFQVAEDVTLNDAGAGTVQLVNRVRTAISASTAVTWMRPTATYRVASGPVRAVHSGGLVQIQDIDLIEHF